MDSDSRITAGDYVYLDGDEQPNRKYKVSYVEPYYTFVILRDDESGSKVFAKIEKCKKNLQSETTYCPSRDKVMDNASNISEGDYVYLDGDQSNAMYEIYFVTGTHAVGRVHSGDEKGSSKILEIGKCRKVAQTKVDPNTVEHNDYFSTGHSSLHGPALTKATIPPVPRPRSVVSPFPTAQPNSPISYKSSSYVETLQIKSSRMEVAIGKYGANILKAHKISGIQDISFSEKESGVTECQITAATNAAVQEARKVLDICYSPIKIKNEFADKFLCNDNELLKRICEISGSTHCVTKRNEEETELGFRGPNLSNRRTLLLIKIQNTPLEEALRADLRKLDEEEEKSLELYKNVKSPTLFEELELDQSVVDLAIGRRGENLIKAYKINGIVDIGIKSLDSKCQIKLLANNQDAINQAKQLLDYYIVRKVIISTNLAKQDDTYLMTKVQLESGVDQIIPQTVMTAGYDAQKYFQVDIHGMRAATEKAIEALKSLLDTDGDLILRVFEEETVLDTTPRVLLDVPSDLRAYYSNQKNVRKLQDSLQDVKVAYCSESHKLTLSAASAKLVEDAKALTIFQFKEARKNQKLLKDRERMKRELERTNAANAAEFSDVFSIPQELVGRVVGKKYSNINRIKNNNPDVVDIDIVKNPIENSAEVRVFANSSSALETVRQQLEYVIINLPLDQNLTARVIGAKGRNIKDISARAGLSNGASGIELKAGVIEIIGPKQNAERASQMLESQMLTFKENDRLQQQVDDMRRQLYTANVDFIQKPLFNSSYASPTQARSSSTGTGSSVANPFWM